MNTMQAPPAGAPREVTPGQLAWLRGELAIWQDAGLVTEEQRGRILAGYREESRLGVRLTLGRVLLTLGGGFVGIGLIWLVAANLDQFSPLGRFVLVALIWLACLAGGEVLAARAASRPLIGGVRLLAALALGAVVFQAAQSLQVPGFEPRLFGVWAAGALVHAYLTRGFAPLLVGIGAGIVWWIAQPTVAGPSDLVLVLALGTGAVVAAGAAVLADGWEPPFAWLWRFAAAALALASLFTAAVPDIGSDGLEWPGWLVVECVTAVLVAGAAIARRRDRALEPVGAVTTVLVGLAIASWTTGTDTEAIDLSDWGHAIVSVLAYVGLAVGLVVLGTVRDHQALTWIALAGLVLFTTFQSFAVFAPIITGGWLFVVLGLVFLATGFLFDRARRELQQALEPATREEAVR